MQVSALKGVYINVDEMGSEYCHCILMINMLHFHYTVGVDDEQLRQIRKPGQVKGQADFSTKTPHLILTLLPSDRVDNPAKKNRKKCFWFL